MSYQISIELICSEKMFEDAQSYGYARHPLGKNFNPSGIPKSHWELEVPASKFLAVVSALSWVVEDNLQSIPKLLSLDHDLRRLCVETLVSPGCVPIQDGRKESCTNPRD